MRKPIHDKIAELLEGVGSPVIFEVGAHEGEDTVELAKISGAVVHAFEADPRNGMLLLGDNIVFNHVAVGDRCDVIDFYQSDVGFGKEWTESGSMRRPKNHLDKYKGVTFKQEPVKVQCVTLDRYCLVNNIDTVDFVWADIQGCEADMIRGGAKMFKTCKYIYTEYSNDELYEGQATLDQILELLGGKFTVIFDDGENVLLRNDTILGHES